MSKDSASPSSVEHQEIISARESGNMLEKI